MNMMDRLRQVSIVLGSKSPRRRELLGKLDIDFDAVSIDADESFSSDIPIAEVAEYLAVKKSEAYQFDLNDSILITSDTTVLCDQVILNKADSEVEATRMLELLSGRTHEVCTGVCIRNKKKRRHFTVTTEVCFKELTQDEIAYYIGTYKPFDKAGSYGIQEWIGMIGITEIKGCYYNVMGLPISKLYKELCEFIEQ